MKTTTKMTKVFVGSVVPIALILMISLWPRGAQAATFDIPNGDVAGLIGAIDTANATPGADTVNLAPSGTYTLTVVNTPGSDTGLPVITSEITINGNGATIQRSSAAGTPNFRIATITSPAGDLTLNEVTIRGGRGVFGGGLFNQDRATLRLVKSTVTDNGGGEGGGIYNFSGGTLTLVNSTITNNTGFGGRTGGGILNISFVHVSRTTIINSTIFENRADGPPGFQGRGDAIADAFSPPGSVIVKNSILASPTSLGNDCFGVVPASLGHNIASDTSCGLTGSGDLNSTNPLLDPLADNGGPTQTHALLPGSPAMDAVPLADCTDANGNPIATDQRGVARPQGPGCDIGAYEMVATITVVIDIKPGSFPNSINPRSKGSIPVAIVSTGTFDAAKVDPTTVLFGPTGTEAAPVRSALANVDGDGHTDMILHFDTQATGIACGNSSASLTGKTLDGQAIEGSDFIRTVGCIGVRLAPSM